MWTLWLITYATVINQGGSGSPVVTALATYQTQAECQVAIIQTSNGLVETYGKKNTPIPGTFFCVGGAPIKK